MPSPEGKERKQTNRTLGTAFSTHAHTHTTKTESISSWRQTGLMEDHSNLRRSKKTSRQKKKP
jgi:hypothetical protein